MTLVIAPPFIQGQALKFTFDLLPLLTDTL